MQVLLGKFNKRKICLSTIAMGLIVLICAVIIQAPIKGRAAGETRATPTEIQYIAMNLFKIGGRYVYNNEVEQYGITVERNILKLENAGNKETGSIMLKINTIGVTIKLEGDNNTLTADVNGIALNSSKDITITGSGTLNVNGNLACRSYIQESGTVNVNGNLACQSYIQQSGTVNVTSTLGVGIQATNDINITGGTTTVKSTRGHGIESTNGGITVGGNGKVDITSTDNAMNVVGIDKTITFASSVESILKGDNAGINIGNGNLIFNNTGNITVTGGNKGIVSSGAIEINTSGSGNTIVNGKDIGIESNSMIMTSGTLTVNKVDNSWVSPSAGIKTNTFSMSNGTLNVTNNGDNTSGIYVTGTSFGINGGTINITSNGSYTNGIYSDIPMTIGDNVGNTDVIETNINIKQSSSNDVSGHGINCTNEVTINEGNVTIGDDYTYNYAVSSNGLTINGGDLQAKGASRGINATGLLTLNGGSIYASNTVVGDNKYIINCENGLTVDGGYINVAANSDHGRAVMVESGNATINNGNIEIDVNGNCARGIEANSNLIIGGKGTTSGPSIIIKGNIQGNDVEDAFGCGILFKNEFTMNSGELTIDMKNLTDTTAISGIRAYGNTSTMTIKGGNININVDVKQSDGTYGHGDGMSLAGTLTLNGGKLVSKTNGTLLNSAALDTSANVTVNGGIAEFRNTNTLDDVNNTGVGICSSTTLNINGGSVIAQGMHKAVILSGNTNINYAQETNDFSITTLVSTDYLGNNLITYDNISSFDSYRYIEFGALFKKMLKYIANENKIYIGETTGGLNVTPDTSLLTQIGISTGASNGNLIFNNMNFQSKLEYGLIIEGDTTIQLVDNTSNTIGANKNENGVGINSTSNITFTGSGNLKVTGASRAINVNKIIYDGGTDYQLKTVCTSTSVTPTIVTEYPTSPDYTSSKYVEIGPVANYYFKYNANQGKMYKVIPGGDTTALFMNNQLVPGWSIKDDKTLELDDFKFVTLANIGLMIDESATVSFVDNNEITLLNGSQPTYQGMNISGDIVLQGSGTINLGINEDTNNKYTGIYSTGNITIKNGTYNIEGGSYGIQAPSNKLTISNANVVVKGNAKAMDVGTCDIHAKVEGSTNYNGINAVTITDINTTYNSTYLGYSYFNISPAIMTVNITWGSMEFSGQSVWEPSTHTYEGKYLPSESGADKILVENMATSNIPIFAKVKYNKLTESSATDLVNSITGTIATDKDNVAIGIGESSTSTLSLDGVITDTLKQNYGSTSTSVGTVSVTLSDYSIAN